MMTGPFLRSNEICKPLEQWEGQNPADNLHHDGADPVEQASSDGDDIIDVGVVLEHTMLLKEDKNPNRNQRSEAEPAHYHSAEPVTCAPYLAKCLL